MSSANKRFKLGSWTLPSGNSCEVYFAPGGHLQVEWDVEPSPQWSPTDIQAWRERTFPEIVQAVQDLTGVKSAGVVLLPPVAGGDRN